MRSLLKFRGSFQGKVLINLQYYSTPKHVNWGCLRLIRSSLKLRLWAGKNHTKLVFIIAILTNFKILQGSYFQRTMEANQWKSQINMFWNTTRTNILFDTLMRCMHILFYSKKLPISWWLYLTIWANIQD